VLNTSYGMDMRCRENISVGRKHMVEVEVPSSSTYLGVR